MILMPPEPVLVNPYVHFLSTLEGANKSDRELLQGLGFNVGISDKGFYGAYSNPLLSTI